MGQARYSPDLSLLYSDGINFTFSRELVELHQQLLNFPSAHKMKIIFTFLPQSPSAKVQPPMQDNGAQSHLSIFFFFIQQYNFSEYNQYKMYMTKYILNRTEDLKAFQ